MLSSCVAPAYTNAFDTMARIEKQHENVQVRENNLVRRIVGANRADKRRMDELRVDDGAKEGKF